MTPMYKPLLICTSLLTLLGSAHVYAEKADSTKPVQVEADRITVDDVKKQHILEGRVILTKGTMIIRSNRVVVSQDANGFQTSVAEGGEGGLARFRQKRENSNEYVDGEAERIEHSDRTQQTDFYTRAYLKSGQDEVRGQFIRYDARIENYTVTNSSSAGKSGGDGRVRAVIQPRNSGPAEPAPTSRSSITLPSGSQSSPNKP